ncbi:MAG: oligosaccharide flippase family protein, partial [Candidatus Edwardsbacteria bacterium]|nr:oligosaccharide flippase family protein [Candidatus Edwardsbacteria bacterium]
MTKMTAVEDSAQRRWTLGVADNTIQSLLLMTVTRAVGLAVSVLVARRLGAEELGVYQQAAILVTTLATVATWGMPTSIIPQLSCSVSEAERRSLINASLFAACGIAIILALSLAALSPNCAPLLLHRPLPGVLRLAAVGVVLLSGSALTG